MLTPMPGLSLLPLLRLRPYNTSVDACSSVYEIEHCTFLHCRHERSYGRQVVSMKLDDDKAWTEIGRTEVVANNLNPSFVTLIPTVREEKVSFDELAVLFSFSEPTWPVGEASLRHMAFTGIWGVRSQLVRSSSAWLP